MTVFVSKSIKDTEKFAENFVKEISKTGKGKKATLVKLSGELGSGKTAFTKGVARALGVRNTVTSPTFVLEKIYILPKSGTFSKLAHIDAYRLERGEELTPLRFEELINDPEALILIEWPERVKDALPTEAHTVSFKVVDDSTRDILWQKKSKKQ